MVPNDDVKPPKILCIFQLDVAVTRMTPEGEVTGYPSLTPILTVPCVPRVGEEIFLAADGVTKLHAVTAVRYHVERDTGMSGVSVVVGEGRSTL